MRELERDRPEAAGATAGPKPLDRVAIIGRGRVGNTLARAAQRAGIEVSSGGREDALAACLGAGAVLLCVPDDSIEEAAATIAPAVPAVPLVGHTSGATGLDALAPAVERGAEAFGMHPLQTVPDGEADLADAPCAVSGSSPEAVAFASGLAEALGMRPFELPEGSRAVYHAAASIASNFLVTVQAEAEALAASAGIEGVDARQMLGPLVRTTGENWIALGSARALTGPVARGDQATVAAQRAAIASQRPQLEPLFDALVERTQALAGCHEPGPVAGARS